MSVLICGSFAFDNIMVFPDQFKNHILPDKVHMLNVSFLVPEMRKEFGGCAGNIAYNLKLLGEEPVPMATVGKDFESYSQWMDKKGISRKHVTVFEDNFTGQAFITTDLDDNQITAFHPGAMNLSHQNNINEAEGISLGIISPDGRDGMLQHAAQFQEADIPFIFDPGQGMPMFSGEELKGFIDKASYVTVNDYEWQLMQERTGYNSNDVANKVKALIVTLGGKGSVIYTEGKEYEIPVVEPVSINDPTGCGDAYRAGLLFGLLNDLDWETAGRVASLIGAIKIQWYGTQNHTFHKAEFAEQFKEKFNYDLNM